MSLSSTRIRHKLLEKRISWANFRLSLVVISILLELFLNPLQRLRGICRIKTVKMRLTYPNHFILRSSIKLLIHCSAAKVGSQIVYLGATTHKP